MFKKIKNWFEMYPPPYADIKGWNDFDKECKKKYPIRYWLNEILIPNTVWPIERRYKSVKDWFRYRLFERLHMINTKLEPGYYDTDRRILYGMFSLLVDFVEIEKAWMQYISNKKYKKPWYHMKRFRDKEMGLTYLEWEITHPEVPDHQSKEAKEIRELYLWWTKDRPNRIDPDDYYYKYIEENPEEDPFYKIINYEMSQEKSKIFEKINKLEQEYYNEDTFMLKRLISIRESLWT